MRSPAEQDWLASVDPDLRDVGVVLTPERPVETWSHNDRVRRELRREALRREALRRRLEGERAERRERQRRAARLREKGWTEAAVQRILGGA